MSPSFSPEPNRNDKPNRSDEAAQRSDDRELFNELIGALYRERLDEGPRVVRELFRPPVVVPKGEHQEAVMRVVMQLEHMPEFVTFAQKVKFMSAVAEATFPGHREGREVTEKLLFSIVEGKPDFFSVEDMRLFASLMAANTFPDNDAAAGLYRQFILAGLPKREEDVVRAALFDRGIDVVDLLPGRLWAQVQRAE